MAIEMIPGEFPELRRSDPKRNAEARVYGALRNLELDGRSIYEFRYREGGRQLDFALWLDGIGRFAVQVKGGEYILDATGQWYLRNPDGSLTPTGSPWRRRWTGASNCGRASGKPPIIGTSSPEC